MVLETNGHFTEKELQNLPQWLESVSFNNAVKEKLANAERVVSINVEKYAKAGDNNSSLTMLIELEVQLKDGNVKNTNFVLKTQQANEQLLKICNLLQLFTKEEQMYHNILPKFENLYKNVGKNLQFAPKAFKFDRDIGEDYVLLEDLYERGFKNANRLNGFDMEHMKVLLARLAEFHAASACYVEHYGLFGKEFTVGVYTESNRELLRELNQSSAFLTQLKKCKNGQYYYDKLLASDSHLVDTLLNIRQYNANEFNVLNHGDLWCNNILFQYDAFGKIKNSLFVDLQVSKYGSPANDLYYLILSSAAQNIKLSQFDYFVRFYFDHLLENLKLLQYHRPLPKLRNLHAVLLKNGLTAYLVVSKVLPIVLFDKNDINLSEDDSQSESKINAAMYANQKYVKAMEEILPWMDNRGLLDWQ